MEHRSRADRSRLTTPPTSRSESERRARTRSVARHGVRGEAAPNRRVACDLTRVIRHPRGCHRRRRLILRGFGQTATVVSLLLSVTFACGVVIAVAHVVNQRFIAPVYDVVANLAAFGCAVAASILLGHPIPATLSGVAIVCWLVLARRTVRDRRERRTASSLVE